MAFIIVAAVPQKPRLMTLQLSVVQYAGRFALQWNLILATFALVAVPIMVLYVFCRTRYSRVLPAVH